VFAFFGEITVPLLFAAIIGAVFSPWVDWLVRHKVKRSLAALLLLLLMLVVGGLLALLIGYAVVQQWPEIQSQVQDGIHEISKAIDENTTKKQADEITSNIEAGVQNAAKGLAGQIPQIIGGFAGFIFMLFIMANVIFFMLKDGGPIGDWVARRAKRLAGHEKLARRLLHDSGVTTRRYIFGVAIVAFFNAAVVGLGALVLGVPLAGVIAIVTFVFAFIPYLGAIVAGAFAVVMAISTSPTAAIIMLLIVIVSNGALQTVVNQFAMKRALEIHPLVVLVVTLLGGVIAGALGAFLATPLTAIFLNVTKEMRRAGKADADDGALPDGSEGPPSDGEVDVGPGVKEGGGVAGDSPGQVSTDPA